MSASRGVAVAQWLTVVLGVVAMILALRGGEEPAPDNTTVCTTVTVTVDEPPSEEQIRRWVQEVIQEQQTAAAGNRAQPRNSQCECGSGRKFKRCHGGPGR